MWSFSVMQTSIVEMNCHVILFSLFSGDTDLASKLRLLQEQDQAKKQKKKKKKVEEEP